MKGLVLEWEGSSYPEVKSGIAKFKFNDELECTLRLDSYSEFNCISKFIEGMFNSGRAEGMTEILMDLKEFVKNVEAE